MLLYKKKREDDKGGEKANRCGKLWEDCNNRGQEPGPPSGVEMIRIRLQMGGMKKKYDHSGKTVFKTKQKHNTLMFCVFLFADVLKWPGVFPLVFLMFILGIPFPSILFID